MIAAVDGYALAAAASCRWLAPGVSRRRGPKLGQPEISLHVIPGFGGDADAAPGRAPGAAGGNQLFPCWSGASPSLLDGRRRARRTRAGPGPDRRDRARRRARPRARRGPPRRPRPLRRCAAPRSPVRRPCSPTSSVTQSIRRLLSTPRASRASVGQAILDSVRLRFAEGLRRQGSRLSSGSSVPRRLRRRACELDRFLARNPCATAAPGRPQLKPVASPHALAIDGYNVIRRDADLRSARGPCENLEPGADRAPDAVARRARSRRFVHGGVRRRPTGGQRPSGRRIQVGFSRPRVCGRRAAPTGATSARAVVVSSIAPFRMLPAALAPSR